MRDDSEPMGKIRLMKCKVALFMLSLCAKCISNFLDFSVLTKVGEEGASQYLHLIFLSILYFSFSLSPVRHSLFVSFFLSFFQFDFKIWVISKNLQEMLLSPLGSAAGREENKGCRGWVWTTAPFSCSDGCQLLRFWGILLWLLSEPHIDAVSVIFLLPTERIYLTLKCYRACSSLNKHPVFLNKRHQL